MNLYNIFLQFSLPSHSHHLPANHHHHHFIIVVDNLLWVPSVSQQLLLLQKQCFCCCHCCHYAATAALLPTAAAGNKSFCTFGNRTRAMNHTSSATSAKHVSNWTMAHWQRNHQYLAYILMMVVSYKFKFRSTSLWRDHESKCSIWN